MHVCPFCNTSYTVCNPNKAHIWSDAYESYRRNADQYNAIARENSKKEYCFCLVEIVGDGSKNIYISDKGMLPVDTTVVVPYGNNEEQIGKVIKSHMFSAGRAPKPVSQTQHIISSGDTPQKDSLSSGRECAFLQSSNTQHEPSVSVQSSSETIEPRIVSDQLHVISQGEQISNKSNFPKTIDQGEVSGTSSSIEQPSEYDTRLISKIEYWKAKLLDTGKRNRVINYKATKRSSLQIIEPEASLLFNKLASSEKTLSFQKPINKDTDIRTYSMIALMETLSYTLNVQKGDIKTTGTIVEREKTLKNLRSKAKLAREEQGTNILYLCFGFIYWREHDREGSQCFKAPLLMMPVTLGLKSFNAPYTISRSDEEIEVNPTLDYLFSTEYNISLPAFEMKNSHSFDEYIAEVEKIVDLRGWKVSREVCLGLFSFLKISMYHDLNEHRDLMMSHPVLRAMAGDREAIGELPPQADHFDFDSVIPTEWNEVVDSDSSQEEAILLSKLGVSFVMQGPPGTGKSQTITNIIAEAMADGKKILFVSEKAAALEVVLKRLTEVHLDDFCLSLHNYKANKKEIIDGIGANLSLQGEYIDSSILSELTELFHDRAFLNAYAEDLHKRISPLDQSVYMVFGHISKLEKATALEFVSNKPTEITNEQYASIRYKYTLN